MTQFVIESLIFILPSYVANVVPAFVKKINLFNTPIDFEQSWKGKRIFGSHKTWRGLIFGVIGASLFSYFQGRGLEVGFLLGLGTLVGDMIGSFIKRRLTLSPGDKNLLVDEIPGTLFALLFAYLADLLTINLYQVIFLIIVGLPIHILANMLWYKLKLKEVPW
jgi:CDP-2,3-bis-(O-geranylgeranyl)-sn-glycerol synthase